MPRRPAVIDNAQVAAVFRSYPRRVAAKLLALRRLILDVASSTEGVGPVVAGDRIDGRVEGVGEIALHIGAAE